jgi:hypothetical protein
MIKCLSAIFFGNIISVRHIIETIVTVTGCTNTNGDSIMTSTLLVKSNYVLFSFFSDDMKIFWYVSKLYVG